MRCTACTRRGRHGVREARTHRRRGERGRTGLRGAQPARHGVRARRGPRHAHRRGGSRPGHRLHRHGARLRHRGGRRQGAARAPGQGGDLDQVQRGRPRPAALGRGAAREPREELAPTRYRLRRCLPPARRVGAAARARGRRARSRDGAVEGGGQDPLPGRDRALRRGHESPHAPARASGGSVRRDHGRLQPAEPLGAPQRVPAHGAARGGYAHHVRRAPRAEPPRRAAGAGRGADRARRDRSRLR